MISSKVIFAVAKTGKTSEIASETLKILDHKNYDSYRIFRVLFPSIIEKERIASRIMIFVRTEPKPFTDFNTKIREKNMHVVNSTILERRKIVNTFIISFENE